MKGHVGRLYACQVKTVVVGYYRTRGERHAAVAYEAVILVGAGDALGVAPFASHGHLFKVLCVCVCVCVCARACVCACARVCVWGINVGCFCVCCGRGHLFLQVCAITLATTTS